MFDCVANQATLVEAMKIAIKSGTVVVDGGPLKAATVDLATVEGRMEERRPKKGTIPGLGSKEPGPCGVSAQIGRSPDCVVRLTIADELLRDTAAAID